MSKSLNPLVVGLDIITVYLFFLEVKKEVLLVETVSISSFQEYIISFQGGPRNCHCGTLVFIHYILNKHLLYTNVNFQLCLLLVTHFKYFFITGKQKSLNFCCLYVPLRIMNHYYFNCHDVCPPMTHKDCATQLHHIALHCMGYSRNNTRKYLTSLQLHKCLRYFVMHHAQDWCTPVSQMLKKMFQLFMNCFLLV